MYKHLYDQFKHYYRGGSVYFYSDPHFGDEEMKHLRKNYIGDEEQIKSINSKIGKNDTIIFLGDIGNVECIKKIRGYKVLIMGNHDTGASNYKRNFAKTSATIWDEGKKHVFVNEVPSINDNHLFDEVYEGILTISDKIILSHEPIEDLPPFLFNIHGHDHANGHHGKNHLNVCAECINYTPISLNELIKKGTFKEVEDIHRITIDKAIEKRRRRMEIVINRCWGGFGLSEEAYKFLGLEWDGYGYKYEGDRANPKLVECVKTLGEKANGKYAYLEVVEIPDDVEWEISDYDGMETIEEKHRTWC